MSLTRHPLLALAAATITLLALVVFASPSDTYAGTFAPALTVCLDDATTADPNPSADGDPEECDGDNTPEVSSTFASSFGIGEEDTNFAAVVAYIPPDWGVVKGDSIPIGTDVGYLDANATLGLINSACNQVLPVHFEFKNSSLDTTDTVSFDDEDENGTNDFADKDDEDNYLSVTKYPEFLNRLFEDVSVPPIRRSSGVAIVAAIPVLLQFLIFPPGTEINEDLPSDEDLGYPSVTVLQNAGDPGIVPEPGPITDFCAPLVTSNVTLGTAEDGTTLFVNPQNGVHTFTTVSFGQRDADNDGFENSLDTCPFDVNEGNPKETLNGDLDNDGLDAACDPNDDAATGGTDSDDDADNYPNRQDNCPLEPNGPDETNQKDTDTDQIGDVCDPDPDVEDGELSFSRLEAEVTIGDGTGTGGQPSDTACPDCYPYVPGEKVEPPDDGDGGSNTGVIIGVAAAVIAAVVVLGGGAALMMRRRNSAS
ncbi:MAG: hypothetical protein WD904_09900 [Dehalococcoidia bacterium]